MSNTETKGKTSKRGGFDWGNFDEKKFFSETDRVAKFFKTAPETE